MVAGEQNIGKRLVVAHQDVEARLHLLDEIGFEQQRLGLGRGRDEDHRGGERDHPRDAVGVAGEPRIAGDALADAARLADIEHLAVGAEHAVDAGAGGRIAQMAADDRDAALQRGGRCGSTVETEIEAGGNFRRVFEFVFEIRFGHLGRQIAGEIGTGRIVAWRTARHGRHLGARPRPVKGASWLGPYPQSRSVRITPHPSQPRK